MTKKWQDKLRQVFLDMKRGARAGTLSAPVLREIVKAPSSEELARYALELAKREQVTVRYRIISPETKNTIAEFGYFYEIPDRIFDEYSDAVISVKPSRDVEIVYSAPEG